MKRIASRLRPTTRDSGATSVEYALMLVCIAAVIVGGATVLGGATNNWLMTPLAGF